MRTLRKTEYEIKSLVKEYCYPDTIYPVNSQFEERCYEFLRAMNDSDQDE